MVGRDDLVVVQAEQDVAEGGDLGPVGRFGALRLIVEGGDSRLELVTARWGPRGRAAVTSAIPSSVALRSRRLRSCSAIGDERPVGAGFHTGHNPR